MNINKFFKILGIVVLGLTLGGNAYALIAIGSERILIETIPSKAKCELINNKGKWYVTSPNKVKIKRSKKPLEVICEKDGYKKTITNLYLRDPKEAADPDNVIDAAISVGIGDPLNVALSIAVLGLEKISAEMGTYGTHRKDNKIIILIKLEKE